MKLLGKQPVGGIFYLWCPIRAAIMVRATTLVSQTGAAGPGGLSGWGSAAAFRPHKPSKQPSWSQSPPAAPSFQAESPLLDHRALYSLGKSLLPTSCANLQELSSALPAQTGLPRGSLGPQGLCVPFRDKMVTDLLCPCLPTRASRTISPHAVVQAGRAGGDCEPPVKLVDGAGICQRSIPLSVTCSLHELEANYLKGSGLHSPPP